MHSTVKKHSSTILTIFTLAIILGGVLSVVAQDDSGAQQQVVCKEFIANPTAPGSAKLTDGLSRPVPMGSTIKFSMTDGVWPYAAGDSLQLGTGTPIKWQDAPEAPWQQGVAESPIMIVLQ